MQRSRIGITGSGRRQSAVMLEEKIRSALIRVLKYKNTRFEFPTAYKRALDELIHARLTLKDLGRISETRQAA